MTSGAAGVGGGAARGRGVGALEAVGPELAQLCVVVLWASTFVVTKGAFDEIDPLAFLFARFALMTALAFAVLAARGKSWRVRRADLPRFAAAGLSGYTLYQLAFVLGLERTSPFSSSLLIALVPLFTIALLALWRESTPATAWLGIGVAIAGVAVFLADKRGSGAAGSLLGDALSLGAALAFAVYGIVNRPLVRDYPTETYSAYTILAGSLPLVAICGPAALAQDWGALTVRGWLAVVYMVVLPVYVAYMLWNWAIARRGVAAASSFTLLVPVVAGLFSALFFGEGFGPLKLGGAALVLAGLAVVRVRRAPG